MFMFMGPNKTELNYVEIFMKQLYFFKIRNNFKKVLTHFWFHGVIDTTESYLNNLSLNHPFAKLPRHQIVFCAQGQGLHLQGPGALTQQLCHNLPGFLRSVENWDII